LSLHGDNRDKVVPSFMIEWGKVELDNLMRYKMDQGSGKHGDVEDKDFPTLMVRMIKYMGEFMTSIDDVNFRGTIEAIADVMNTGRLLFPKAQMEYEKQLDEIRIQKRHDVEIRIDDHRGDQESTRLE